MSDGNINRKLLPATNFQSGLRAGEARAKQRALQALEACLSASESLFPMPEERSAFLRLFKSEMDKMEQ